MNYVQIWAIIYSAVFVMRLGARIADANSNSVPDITAGDRVLLLLMDMAAALPLVGRIFGWW